MLINGSIHPESFSQDTCSINFTRRDLNLRTIIISDISACRTIIGMLDWGQAVVLCPGQSHSK